MTYFEKKNLPGKMNEREKQAFLSVRTIPHYEGINLKNL